MVVVLHALQSIGLIGDLGLFFLLSYCGYCTCISIFPPQKNHDVPTNIPPDYSDYKTVTIQKPTGPDYQFEGKLLVEHIIKLSFSDFDSHSYKLWKTISGKYVSYIWAISDNREWTHQPTVFSTAKEVVNFIEKIGTNNRKAKKIQAEIKDAIRETGDEDLVSALTVKI